MHIGTLAPFADRDSERVNLPIDGANDGASGVGVLLEIARNISLLDPLIGVDIILFDAEDYGAPNMSGQFFDLNSMNDTHGALVHSIFAKTFSLRITNLNMEFY